MFNKALALELLKSRMDRPGIAIPDEMKRYWEQRLIGTVPDLEAKGVKWDDDENSIADNLLIADYAAFKITNRDNSGKMPEWLRIELRERVFRSK